MATIKDVAKLAGVGIGTASRVLSGRGSVAAPTAERVRRAIDELDFRPSHAARVLLSGASQTVGVYIPVLTGTFYTPILDTVDSELRKTGQHMVVAFGSGEGDAREQARSGLNFLFERGCDGVLAITDALDDDDIVALGSWQQRMVVLNHLYASIPEQCFSVDHVSGGRLAARTLLELGHRKIAVIAGPPTAADNVARLGAFLDEIEASGIPRKSCPVYHGDYSPASGWACADRIVLEGVPYTAVFSANDEMAIGAISRLHDAGIVVPRDLSILGYDDTQTAEYSAPKLSSVHVSWREVTIDGLNSLRNHIYGFRLPVRRQAPVSITRRGSLAEIATQPAGTRRRPAGKS